MTYFNWQNKETVSGKTAGVDWNFEAVNRKRSPETGVTSLVSGVVDLPQTKLISTRTWRVSGSEATARHSLQVFIGHARHNGDEPSFIFCHLGGVVWVLYFDNLKNVRISVVDMQVWCTLSIRQCLWTCQSSCPCTRLFHSNSLCSVYGGCAMPVGVTQLFPGLCLLLVWTRYNLHQAMLDSLDLMS